MRPTKLILIFQTTNVILWATYVVQMCEYTMTDGAKTDISNAEFNVLEALWEQFPATSTELVERLNKQKEWHEKTVRTLLSRLVKKQDQLSTRRQTL